MTSVSLKSLQDDRSTLYLLDADFDISWVNSGWYEFARENGGGAVLERNYIGVNLFDLISDPLKDFYLDLFRRTQEVRQPEKHFYECGSSTLFRLFQMIVFPVSDGGLLTVHSPVIERPYDDRSPIRADQLVYTNENGLIRQCSHCRRVERAGSESWDWVPEYVEDPPSNISHGLCVVCYQYYYPDVGRRSSIR